LPSHLGDGAPESSKPRANNGPKASGSRGDDDGGKFWQASHSEDCDSVSADGANGGGGLAAPEVASKSYSMSGERSGGCTPAIRTSPRIRGRLQDMAAATVSPMVATPGAVGMAGAVTAVESTTQLILSPAHTARREGGRG